MRDKRSVLKEYFVHNSFRGKQDKITVNLLSVRETPHMMPEIP